MLEHNADAKNPNATHADADARSGFGQLDPSVKIHGGNGYVLYKLSDAVTGVVVARVLVTNETLPQGAGESTVFRMNTEYWQPVDRARFNTDDYPGGLRVERTEHAWTEAPPLSPTDAHVFKQPVYQNQWPIATHNQAFQTVNDASDNVQWGFRVDVAFTTSWRGSVQWMKQVADQVLPLTGTVKFKRLSNVMAPSYLGGLD